MSKGTICRNFISPRQGKLKWLEVIYILGPRQNAYELANFHLKRARCLDVFGILKIILDKI